MATQGPADLWIGTSVLDGEEIDLGGVATRCWLGRESEAVRASSLFQLFIIIAMFQRKVRSIRRFYRHIGVCCTAAVRKEWHLSLHYCWVG